MKTLLLCVVLAVAAGALADPEPGARDKRGLVAPYGYGPLAYGGLGYGYGGVGYGYGGLGYGYPYGLGYGGLGYGYPYALGYGGPLLPAPVVAAQLLKVPKVIVPAVHTTLL